MRSSREKAVRAEESLMDFPKDGLCPEVWQKAMSPDGTTETWLLLPEVEATILDLVREATSRCGFQEPTAIRVVGSIASTQWTEDCDVDVHLLGLAPVGDESDAAAKKLRATVRELKASGFKTSIGKHPIELYAQGNKFQDLMSAGCYDVLAKRWDAGPDLVDPEFNPWGAYMAGIQKTAGERISKIRNQIFSVYEIAIAVEKNGETEFGKNLRKPFREALASAAELYTEARAERRSFSDPQSEEEALAMRMSDQWKISNAAFKLLDKYGYTPVLRKFSELSELLESSGGELDVEVAQQVLEAVRKNIAKADELSEKEIFGEAEEKVDEGVFQNVALAALLAIPGILPAAKVHQAVSSVPRAEQRVKNPAVQKQLKAATEKIGKFSKATAANVLAWCLYGEANNQSSAGKKAVASVIFNRAGGDVQKLLDVVLKPAQFSSFNSGNPWGLSIPKTDSDWTIKVPPATLRHPAELRSWNECVQIAAQLANGTFKSTIGNRNSYLNKTVVQRTNPSVLQPGGWGAKLTKQMVVGDHTFGYLKANDGNAKAQAKKAIPDLRSKAKLVYGPPKTQPSAGQAKAKPAAPKIHVVKKGDTLWSIAKANKTTAKAIAKKNGISVSTPLKIGRKLSI